MSLRLGRRDRGRPGVDALDRSLTHVRVLIGLAGGVLSAWTWQREGSMILAVAFMAAAGVCVAALGERRLRRWIDAGRLSAVMTALDTAVIVILLGLNGVEPGDPASLLLVLPLIEAGVRHGVFGVILTWTTISLALFGHLAITWTGLPEQAQDPMKIALILLVVGLPGGRLAEHLALRTVRVEELGAEAIRRSELVMHVFECAALMSSGDGSHRDATLIAAAGPLGGGLARISERTVDDEATGGAAFVATSESGSRLSVELGGSPPRLLHVTAEQRPTVAAVEALELLAAHVRTLESAAQRDGESRTAIDAGAEPPIEPPIGRSIEELIADRTPSHDILDRPELDRHLVRLLEPAVRGPVGLVIVSLDNLALMNDLHGRAAGDQLISATTHRLLSAIGNGPAGELPDGSTTTCRTAVGWMGGDDFVVAVDDCTLGPDDLVADVRAALAGRVDIGRFGSISIHAGVGAAVAAEADRSTGPQLMRRALECMVADRRDQNRRFLDSVDVDFGLDAIRRSVSGTDTGIHADVAPSGPAR